MPIHAHSRARCTGYSGITEAGGLLSYSPNIPGLYRRSAYYVHCILNGTKPSELPVEQASTFEMIVNLKTAKALGIIVPPVVMVQATQVIQ